MKFKNGKLKKYTKNYLTNTLKTYEKEHGIKEKYVFIRAVKL